MTDARLRAICDLSVPVARETVGRHEYDGVIQDLSPDGVRRGLARLGGGNHAVRYRDGHDEAQVAAAENALRVRFGDLESHRTNPAWHLANLELSTYEREYAPAEQRAHARTTHLATWPDAVDMAVASLDRVPAPVAEASLPTARGLTAHLRPEDGAVGHRASAAVGRLIDHLARAARDGEPSAALGHAGLTRLLSSSEACEVDLARLVADADAERDRVREVLVEACGRVDPSSSVEETVRRLRTDHPDVDGAVDEARMLVDEVITWTGKAQLVPHLDGECRVGLMPDSQRWTLAGMFWAAPYEDDAPSWFRVTPPDPSWHPDEQREWLANGFNRMVLPNIAIHEVAPGHFAHSRALRHAPGDVRRTVLSEAFIEGWAHYCEELALEEGFRATDPRFAIGVALDALRRVTRLTCAIGVHTGAMSTTDAAARFTADALLDGQAATAEARRAWFDPTYGHYTWGKLAIRQLRERVRARQGTAFSLPEFHAALLSFGAPALGLLDNVLDVVAVRGRDA